MSNNCYLLTCKHTGEQVLIDAADASATLLPLIGDAGLTHVLTTHQHWDHHRALADVVGATSAATVAGVPDAAAITEQTGVPIALEVGAGRHRARGRLHARGDRPRRPHPRLDRAALRRLRFRGRPPAPLHRRLAVPRRGRQHLRRRRRLRPAPRRRVHQGLRPAPGRHVVLPRPRQRLDARRRAAAPRRSGASAAGSRADGPGGGPPLRHCVGVRRLAHRWPLAPTSRTRTSGTPLRQASRESAGRASAARAHQRSGRWPSRDRRSSSVRRRPACCRPRYVEPGGSEPRRRSPRGRR